MKMNFFNLLFLPKGFTYLLDNKNMITSAALNGSDIFIENKGDGCFLKTCRQEKRHAKNQMKVAS